MSTPNLWADLIRVGLAANRPTTPNTPSGGTALYYSTDTGELNIWTGSAWTIAGNVTVPVTVANLPASPKTGQYAVVSDATTPTLGSTVAGSGAVQCSVVYNGTNWKVA